MSSSSDGTPCTPGMGHSPIHPPSGFSDSRELSEAECDRDNKPPGITRNQQLIDNSAKQHVTRRLKQIQQQQDQQYSELERNSPINHVSNCQYQSFDNISYSINV